MYSAVIIDDEKYVIKSLKATLHDMEHFSFVAEFNDGLSALEYLRAEKPELAFLDVRMPGLSGLELLEKAYEEHLPTLFIIISGYADFTYAQSALRHNALGYCLKPFDRADLMASVEKARELLEKRAPAASPSTPGSRNKAVNTMLAYVEEHYMDDISMQSLADLCHMSLNYAGQLFRQSMDQTFSSYLTDLRIRHAVELLTGTDMPVAQVAARVGYRDYFYFAKVFKRATGVTPSGYRQEDEPE